MGKKEKQKVFSLNGKQICDAEYFGDGWELTFKDNGCYTLLTLNMNGELFVTGFTRGEHAGSISQEDINAFNEVLERNRDAEEAESE